MTKLETLKNCSASFFYQILILLVPPASLPLPRSSSVLPELPPPASSITATTVPLHDKPGHKLISTRFPLLAQLRSSNLAAALLQPTAALFDFPRNR